MRDIFVFGSNMAGRHGKGAALEAVKYWGAEYGNGSGLQGNSYAIPTKDANLKTLPLKTITSYIAEFIEFASGNPSMRFLVTPVGSGLAGHHRGDIADIFFFYLRPLDNVVFTHHWFSEDDWWNL